MVYKYSRVNSMGMDMFIWNTCVSVDILIFSYDKVARGSTCTVKEAVKKG